MSATITKNNFSNILIGSRKIEFIMQPKMPVKLINMNSPEQAVLPLSLLNKYTNVHTAFIKIQNIANTQIIQLIIPYIA